MGKTRGAHSLRPRVRQGPTPPVAGPSATAAGTCLSVSVVRPSVVAASLAPFAVQSPTAGDAEGSSFVAPAYRRYHTWIGLTPPASSHPRPARRAPPAKRAWTSGLGESSTLRSRAPPSPPYQGIAGAPYLSPASIIRRPYFLATTSRGMLAAGGEISMERFTTTSRHLPQTQGFKTPWFLYSDTIWIRSWCRVSSIILGSSSSYIIR